MLLEHLKPLNELIEPRVTQRKSNFDSTSLIKRANSHKPSLIKVIGNGEYSTAVSHDSFPGEVIKISKKVSKPSQDGYLNFLVAICNNKRMQGNPYLPKVYKIKIYKTEQGQYFYMAYIEKLHLINDLSYEELQAIVDKALHIGVQVKAPDMPRSKNRVPDEDKRRVLFKTLVGSLDATLDYYPKEEGRELNIMQRHFNKKSADTVVNIKDPQLKQAIIFTKDRIRKGKALGDLHAGNMMIRRTPVGAQLVITDPLQNGWGGQN